jgi:hypothetical protein
MPAPLDHNVNQPAASLRSQAQELLCAAEPAAGRLARRGRAIPPGKEIAKP